MDSAIRQKICIVVPVHNEQENVAPLTDEILAAISGLERYDFEILFVDDGSVDGTLAEIEKLIAHHLPVGYVKLSRNFGHQHALEAGLSAAAAADVVITMDGDLQHPPQDIPRMIERYEAGADVVQMRRRNMTNSLKGLLSLSFYTFFKWISDAPLVSNAADFRLVSRRVVAEILRNPGRVKLLRAQVPAIGFEQVHLEYTQMDRLHGTPSYTYSSLYGLAMQTMFKFSQFPAQVTFALGLLLLIAAPFCALIAWLAHLSAYFTILLPAFFIGVGSVFTVGGVICWYLYFILEQVRHDATYIVDRTVRVSDPQA